jgi:hypothetical protein
MLSVDEEKSNMKKEIETLYLEIDQHTEKIKILQNEISARNEYDKLVFSKIAKSLEDFGEKLKNSYDTDIVLVNE